MIPIWRYENSFRQYCRIVYFMYSILCFAQVSIMQMTGLKKRLETTLNKDESSDDKV